MVQPYYAGKTRTGPNYKVGVHLDYHLALRWRVNVFASANNARDFATETVGITLEFLMRPLPTHTDLRVRAIPDWRGDQPRP